MDPVLQAYTGLMAENRGEDGVPHRVPVIVVDMSTALYAFQALSAALYARRDEPRGRYIDVSLMQAATALQSIRLMGSYLEGGAMKPGGVPGGVFQTADGWMSILALNDRDWRGLCGAMEMPALADDPRFVSPRLRLENDVALYAIVRPAVAARSSAEWSKRLTDAKLMHERLNSYLDFLEQPHVKETGLIQWLAQAGLDRPVPVPALPGMLPADRPHAARNSTGSGPAHPGNSGRIRLRRGGDRRPARPRRRRRRMITRLDPVAVPPHAVEERWRRHRRHRRAGRRLALRPHADHDARPVLRLCRLRPVAGPRRRPRPRARHARRRDRRAHAVQAGALHRRDAGSSAVSSRGRSRS